MRLCVLNNDQDYSGDRKGRQRRMRKARSTESGALPIVPVTSLLPPPSSRHVSGLPRPLRTCISRGSLTPHCRLVLPPGRKVEKNAEAGTESVKPRGFRSVLDGEQWKIDNRSGTGTKGDVIPTPVSASVLVFFPFPAPTPALTHLVWYHWCRHLHWSRHHHWCWLHRWSRHSFKMRSI